MIDEIEKIKELQEQLLEARLDIHKLLDAGMCLKSFREGTDMYKQGEELYDKISDKYPR